MNRVLLVVVLLFIPLPLRAELLGTTGSWMALWYEPSLATLSVTGSAYEDAVRQQQGYVVIVKLYDWRLPASLQNRRSDLVEVRDWLTAGLGIWFSSVHGCTGGCSAMYYFNTPEGSSARDADFSRLSAIFPPIAGNSLINT
jgi:hypothetical protein